ncbi:MAG: TolC family protein [bacterium]|nr:TolC family protein [bacterium]
MARSAFPLVAGLGLIVWAGGCHQWFINEADREVNDLIASRQQAALGETHPVHIGDESGQINSTGGMYRFAPHPVDPDVPEGFKRPAAEPGDATSQPADADQEPVFTLADCLAYALDHAREYQTAKEDLYLSALALTLERHLWTPRFSGELSFEFADYGQVRDFDRAMTAVASLAVEQRLPLGGTVTARVIDRWMRDLVVHTTSGETGDIILSTDIPLLRGAGRVAYESRYQTERDLIYAVRDFERFRRQFVVDLAGDYFDLLSTRARIESARAQAYSLTEARDQAMAKKDMTRAEPLDFERADVAYRNARNGVISAREQYDSSLDQFKIRLGMSTAERLDLAREEIELFEPDVSEADAVHTALRYRLDLLNQQDAVDDARRGVKIAQNNLLPDFNFTGSVSMNTNPNKPSTLEYNTERTTWRGMVELELPLDRKEERNLFRSALIDLRRSERRHEEFSDRVRAEVRRAKRQIALFRLTLEIQAENTTIGEFRAAQAKALWDRGRLRSNRDVIEAENDLRDARNTYADAQADYRVAILDFLLSAGALRIRDDGGWVTYPAPPAPPATPD